MTIYIYINPGLYLLDTWLDSITDFYPFMVALKNYFYLLPNKILKLICNYSNKVLFLYILLNFIGYNCAKLFTEKLTEIENTVSILSLFYYNWSDLFFGLGSIDWLIIGHDRMPIVMGYHRRTLIYFLIQYELYAHNCIYQQLSTMVE